MLASNDGHESNNYGTEFILEQVSWGASSVMLISKRNIYKIKAITEFLQKNWPMSYRWEKQLFFRFEVLDATEETQLAQKLCLPLPINAQKFIPAIRTGS